MRKGVKKIYFFGPQQDSASAVGRFYNAFLLYNRGIITHNKITKEQLEQLAHGVKRLHEVTEKLCKEKIDSFG